MIMGVPRFFDAGDANFFGAASFRLYVKFMVILEAAAGSVPEPHEAAKRGGLVRHFMVCFRLRRFTSRERTRNESGRRPSDVRAGNAPNDRNPS